MRAKPTILVVDDSPDSLGMINTALDEAGYTVLMSLNGEQALAITEQMTPDVILMDAIMPQMDGFECCQRMREKLPFTPVIFMTGLTDSENIVRAFECGGRDYVSKPIDPAELIARIRTHLLHAHMLGDAYDALDKAQQFLFAVNQNGALQWATPGARQILSMHADCDRLLEKVQAHHQSTPDQPLTEQFGKRDLNIAFFKVDPAQHSLFKLEQSEAVFDAGKLESNLGITRREAEVLLWVAQGKSNKQIADVLSVSPRTINKHLEQLFPKINVDNRAGATSVAIRSLLTA